MIQPSPPARSVVRGKRRSGSGALLAAICLVLSIWPTVLAAHGDRASGSHAGIPIPSLTHGEMALIAPYYRRIVAVAEDVPNTDETFRRLLNFAQIQRAYCLWGIMPGSVNDEESPFNECSHAYLAAAKAVLLQMRMMNGDRASVEDLVSDIDAILVRNNLSLVLCKFSGESFNTADLVRPRPADIVVHGKSLMTVLSALMAAGAGLWLAACALRNGYRS
ncbi:MULTISPECIES: hypothetical protein [Rhizobium]|uniref:Transmembrane protein n=1 Tax=Rhizobium miluonense TaxID=411945 RepID=A0A1C3X5W3_9HYPH|nr:hypothetical protein [Rhizobium miluonense]SCB47506.1 hypothetical protein GA0061102_105922 [Rhizobium miluonense]